MRISDWSADVCSSDLPTRPQHSRRRQGKLDPGRELHGHEMMQRREEMTAHFKHKDGERQDQRDPEAARHVDQFGARPGVGGNHFRLERSEEHTSELQSLMRISYAVIRLKNKKHKKKD